MNPFKLIKNTIKTTSDFLKVATMLDLTSWIIFLIATVGFGAIFYIWIVLKPSNTDILTAIVLWVTAIAIFKYTRETRDLKDVSQKQLEQDRYRNDFDIAPFIDVSINGSDVTVKNNGKGVAKNIELNCTIKGMSYSIEISSIGAGDSEILKVADYDELFSAIGEIEDDGKIPIDGEYEDYLGRKYSLVIESYNIGKSKILKQEPQKWSFGKGNTK